MIKIPINSFNSLELEANIINKVNNTDHYYDVYLLKRKEEKKIIGEIKINLKENQKSKISLIRDGKIKHPNIILKLNSFIDNYKYEK